MMNKQIIGRVNVAKRILIIMVMAGGLLACATDAPKYNPKEFDTANYQKNVDNAVDAADILKDFDISKVPTNPLEVQDLSTLVQADLFYNQGQYISAYPLYKELAFKYKDPRIIYKAIICLEHVSVTSTQIAELNALVNLFIEIDPNSKLAKLFQIKVALRSNDPVLAKKNLDSLINNNPNNARAIFLFISSIVSSDLTPNSQNAVNKFANLVVNDYANYPEANLLSVVAYANTNNLEQLTKELDYIHLHYPNWNIPLYWSLDVLAHNNHRIEVIKVVEPILDAQSIPDPILQNIYIAALIDTEQLKKAETYLRSQLKIGKNNQNNVLMNLGIVMAKSGDYKQAISYLKQTKIVDLGIKNVVDMTLGTFLDYQGDNLEAIKYYQKVSNAKLFPIRDSMLLNDYITIDNYQAANVILDKMAKNEGMNENKSTLFKSSYYIGIGKYQIAYNILRAKSNIYVKDKEYLYQYASVSAILNKTNQAIKLYKDYIKMEPNQAYGYNDLAYIYADQTNKYKLAKEYADHAYKLAPTDPTILDTIGWAYFKLGEPVRALAYIKTSYEITNDPESAKHLIKVYNALNQQNMAKKVVVQTPDMLRQHFKALVASKMLKLLMYAQFGRGAE